LHLGNGDRNGVRSRGLRFLLFGIGAAAAEKRDAKQGQRNGHRAPKYITNSEALFCWRKIQIGHHQGLLGNNISKIKDRR